MNILIVNEYVDYSGAEQIVKMQVELFKSMGINVKCLFFQIGNATKVDNENDIIIHSNKLTKFLFNPILYLKVNNFIKHFNPDVIIAHNIVTSPVTVYQCFKRYKVIQTVHDGKIICPTAWLMKPITFKTCEGYKGEKCLLTCREASKSRLRLLLSLIIVHESEIQRKKYIDYFVTPSQALKEIIERYGYKSICINNPINEKEINYRPKKLLNYRFIYAGIISPYKGVELFYKNLKDLNFSIDIDLYGSYTNDKATLEFIDSLKNDKHVKYIGRLSHSDLMNKLDEYDFLIMPSLWVENYPTIVLEAMAHGILVIGSNRGGIPELLLPERGIVFNPLDRESIESAMKTVLNLKIEDYNQYIKNSYEYVRQNNSVNQYSEKLMGLVNELVCSSVNVH